MFLLIVFIVISGTLKVTMSEEDNKKREEEVQTLRERNIALSSEADELMRQKAMLAEAAAEVAAKLENEEAEAAAAAHAATQLEAERGKLIAELESLRGTLRAEVEAKDSDREATAAQMKKLSEEISRLSNSLDVSEQKAKEKEVQYVELSSRFNRALADKMAELGDMREYQSMFFGAIKKSLGGSSLIQMDEDRFTLPSDILFPSGSAVISEEGKRQLGQIAGVIKEIYGMIPSSVSWIIRVDGHTDSVPIRPGSPLKDNIQLSLMRARVVVDELSKHGIDHKLLIPSGFGEQYPIASNNTPETRQKNRRIELRLTNP
jgi:chemotaxis protein MotB